MLCRSSALQLLNFTLVLCLVGFGGLQPISLQRLLETSELFIGAVGQEIGNDMIYSPREDASFHLMKYQY